MSDKKWLRILIPIQGLLITSQLVTGLNANRIPFDIFRIVHIGGGSLLFAIIVFHVAINWKWIYENYFKRPLDGDSDNDAS